MLAEKSEGKDYVIRNVCKTVKPHQMAHHMKHAVKWNIRVDKMDTKSRYSKTFDVFSKEAPRLWSPMMMDQLTEDYQAVTISEMVMKGSCKGLRCFKPREEEEEKDDEGWSQYRTGGARWADASKE